MTLTALRTLAVAVTLALTPALVAQARPDDALLARLTGRWEGTGVILGQASRMELTWAPTLDAQFHELTFRSHIGPAPTTRVFEGRAFYRATAAGYRATWFDSSGLTRPIEATRTESAIVATWGTAETEIGETTYRLLSADRLEVVDRVKRQDGTWREFGRSALARLP